MRSGRGLRKFVADPAARPPPWLRPDDAHEISVHLQLHPKARQRLLRCSDDQLPSAVASLLRSLKFDQIDKARLVNDAAPKRSQLRRHVRTIIRKPLPAPPEHLPSSIFDHRFDTSAIALAIAWLVSGRDRQGGHCPKAVLPLVERIWAYYFPADLSANADADSDDRAKPVLPPLEPTEYEFARRQMDKSRTFDRISRVLPKELREVLMLRVLDHPPADIAKRLELSLATVYRRLEQITERLKKLGLSLPSADIAMSVARDLANEELARTVRKRHT